MYILVHRYVVGVFIHLMVFSVIIDRQEWLLSLGSFVLQNVLQAEELKSIKKLLVL